jgi:hypothetical protein
VLAHQPLNPLTRDSDATPVQGGVDPRRTVRAARAAVDLGDLGEELVVGLAPRRRIPLLAEPAVERRGCDAKDAQDRTDAEPGSQLRDDIQYFLLVGSIS